MTKFTHKIKNYQNSDKRVVDSLLHSGVITVGNQNDYINMFNRVCPNISEPLRIDIQNSLEEQFDNDSKIKYLFNQESIEEDFVLSFDIPTGYLYFTNL